MVGHKFGEFASTLFLEDNGYYEIKKWKFKLKIWLRSSKSFRKPKPTEIRKKWYLSNHDTIVGAVSPWPRKSVENRENIESI